MWRSSLLVLASALVINAASPSSVEAKISDPRKVALVAALVAVITGTYGGYYHIVGADGEREARGIVAQMDDAHAAAAVLKAVQISVASAATDQNANPEVVVSTALNVLQALEPKLSAETGDARGGANRNGGRSSRPGTPEYPGIGHIRSTLTEVLAIGPGPLKHEEIGAALAQAERSLSNDLAVLKTRLDMTSDRAEGARLVRNHFAKVALGFLGMAGLVGVDWTRAGQTLRQRQWRLRGWLLRRLNPTRVSNQDRGE